MLAQHVPQIVSRPTEGIVSRPTEGDARKIDPKGAFPYVECHEIPEISLGTICNMGCDKALHRPRSR